MKTLKTALSMLMVFCMLLSFGTAAFADIVYAGDVPPEGSGTQTGIWDGKTDITYVNTSGGELGTTVNPGTGPQLPPGPENGSNTGDVQATVQAAPAPAPAPAPAAESGQKIEGSVSAGISSIGYVYVKITPDNTGVSESLTLGSSYSDDAGNPMVTYESNDPLKVTVSADIDSVWNGIDATGFGGSVIVNAKGVDVTAEGFGIAAVSHSTNSSPNSVTVTAGDVTSTSNGIYAGIYAVGGGSDGPGTTTVTAENVTSENCVGIHAAAYAGGTAKITAGSVTSENGAGIEAKLSLEDGMDNGMIDITVGTVDTEATDGLLKAADSGSAILLDNSVTETNAGNLSITVWKIEGGTDKDGNVVSGGQSGAAAAVQENINYIVRIAADDISQSVFKGNEGTLHSGKQLIKVTVPEGYKLYATEGTDVEIKKDGDAYYATIPVGGGIYLNAVLDKPDPKPDKKTEAPVIQVEYVSVKCTFDLDGGTLDGETGKVTRWYVPGATVKLPAAPTKDNSTFAGWETKINGEKKVFEAGEKFEVTGAQSFTALWD